MKTFDYSSARLRLACRVATWIFCSCLVLPAQADEFRYEITPFGGYRTGGEFNQVDSDATVELDDAASFGLILSGRDSGHTQWEVLYSQQATSADTSAVPGVGSSSDLDVRYLQIGGTYQFDGRVARPYIAATFGGARFEPDAAALDDDTFWAFTFGTGLQFRPGERVGFRLEARAYATVLDSDSKILCVSGAGAVCAFAIEGDILWQVEAFAGVTVRF